MEEPVKPSIEELGEAARIERGPPNDSSLNSCNSLPVVKLHPDAYHGIAGEFARAMAPYTEAAEAPMLVQFLVAAGSAFGRGPRYMIGIEDHHCNLFVVLVGGTGQGKGSSWSNVRAVFALAMVELNEASGLSSGEGLVKAFAGEDGAPVTKLVHEPEFASVLSVARREASTLTSVMRALWDRDHAEVITRKEPLKVAGANLSVIAHTTPADLSALWQAKDSANGFGNRFLWILAFRERTIPFPKEPPGHVVEPLAARLSEAVSWAQSLGNIKIARSKCAEARFIEELPDLLRFSDRSDIVGNLSARSRVMVWRLAMIYALLDKSTVIECAHMRAALAIVKHSHASLELIFAAPPSADERKIVEVLGREGGMLTQTGLSNALGRNWPADRLKDATDSLVRRGRIEVAGNGTARIISLVAGR